MKNFKKRKMSAFSLIELMLSLTIIFIAVSMIVYIFSVVSETHKLNTAFQELVTIKKGVDTLSVSYSNMDDIIDKLKDSDFFPTYMVNKKNDTFISPWKGKLTITSRIENGDNYYDVTFYNIPEKSCVGLIQRSKALYTKAGNTNGGFVSNNDAASVVNFCKAITSDEGIVFSNFYEGDDAFNYSVSTSTSISVSASYSTSTSVSNSISASLSASESVSASTSASVSASTSASISSSVSASVSSSVSSSVSASNSASTSVSISNSLSASEATANANRVDPSLSASSKFVYDDGGLDGYQIGIYMYLSNGRLQILPGNYGVDLTGLLNSGTPYLNYSNPKISSMITHAYGYNFELGCTNSNYYDDCEYVDDGEYLDFTSYNAFNVSKGLTVETAVNNLIKYWVANNRDALIKRVKEAAFTCDIPGVSTALIMSSIEGENRIRYEISTDGTLYEMVSTKNFTSCNTTADRTIKNDGKIY